MEFLIGLIGFILFVWAAVTMVDSARATTRFVFDFEDGVMDLDIDAPGFYSIAVVGAGFLDKIGQVRTALRTDTDMARVVRPYWMAPRSRMDGHIATSCWYFSAETPGHYTLSLSNLSAVEAKESMLLQRRLFQAAIDSRRLKLVVYKSMKPLYQFLVPAGLMLGLVMMGTAYILLVG